MTGVTFSCQLTMGNTCDAHVSILRPPTLSGFMHKSAIHLVEMPEVPDLLRRRDGLTFLLACAASAIVGCIGGDLVIRHVKMQLYVQESESERRNVESMSGLLERELQSGYTTTELIAQLQAATQRMADEDGYLCLLDRNGMVLSHPKP